MVRRPVVAGQFYPDQKDELLRLVRDLSGGNQSPRRVIGTMVPHAGYIFSGAIAGETLSAVDIPATVILLGPNHTGFGAPLAVFPAGAWETPLGEMQIDGPMSERIVRECPGAAADKQAHRLEHSLEVLIPFIQVRSPGSSIVPICVGQSSLEVLLDFGSALGRLLASRANDALLVASSDMTHFESADQAREKDLQAIDKILALDPAGLYRVVRELRISMCGVYPTVVMLAAAKELKASRANLVRYGTSGDVTGEKSDVVGYAGVIVE